MRPPACGVTTINAGGALAITSLAASYLTAGVPVGRHLADQLLLPLAMGQGGTFRTLARTAHTTTNVAVIGRFLDVTVAIERESEHVSRIAVRAPS